MARPRTKYLVDVPCQHCGEMMKPQERYRTSGQYNGVWMPQKFCSTACANYARGPAKGHVDRHGYKVLPTPRNAPQIYEHHDVMAKILGRKLTAKETVHHINGDRSDNRPENLELWASRHGRGQRVSDFHPMCAVSYTDGALSLGG